MRKACILRATGHKSFAVKFTHFPGIVEVHCSDLEVNDNIRFAKDIRSLICHKIASKQPVDASKAGIDVDIELGQYCVNVRAFVSSKLRYPSIIVEGAYENAFSDDTSNHQFHMDDIDGNVTHVAGTPRNATNGRTAATMEDSCSKTIHATVASEDTMECSSSIGIRLPSIVEDTVDGSCYVNSTISQLSLDPA
jgi:hypothetical protein